MWWRPIVGFFEVRKDMKEAMIAEYGLVAPVNSVPAVNLSEVDLASIRMLRQIADKLERGEPINIELDRFMDSHLIQIWRVRQPKPSRTGWGNV